MKNEVYFRLLTYLEAAPTDRKDLVNELKEYTDKHRMEDPAQFRDGLRKYDNLLLMCWLRNIAGNLHTIRLWVSTMGVISLIAGGIGLVALFWALSR